MSAKHAEVRVGDAQNQLLTRQVVTQFSLIGEMARLLQSDERIGAKQRLAQSEAGIVGGVGHLGVRTGKLAVFPDPVYLAL